MSNLTMVEQLNRPGMNRVRALIKAMGYDAEDLRRPRIGVHNTWSETSPGHIHLKAVTEAVKAGIWQAGGTPVEFGGFAQCPVDVGSGGMRYDTPTRDVIAAEVETCAQIHNFEGLVLISSCDKNVPGHLLAAARLDLPAIIVPGGPMLAGRFQGKDVIITDLDAETWACGVGRPRLTASEMDELEHAVCPTAGSCALLGTANTMQCLAEAVGLALPGSATAPAPTAQRLWFAKQSGRRIVELIRDDLRPSRIVTADALENMIKVLHAIGGSTNAVLHILALAQELDLGERITLETIAGLSRRGGLHRQRPTQRDATPCRTSTRRAASRRSCGGWRPPAPRQPDGHRADSLARTSPGPWCGAKRSSVLWISPYSEAAWPFSAEVWQPPPSSGRPWSRNRCMAHRGPARVFDSMEDCLAGSGSGTRAGRRGCRPPLRGLPRWARTHRGLQGCRLPERARPRHLLRPGDRRQDLRLRQGPLHLPGLPRGSPRWPHRPGAGRRPHRGGHPESSTRPAGGARRNSTHAVALGAAPPRA